MLQSSGKRAASSPLSSEFDKRPKLGLTDDEVNDLNEHLNGWIQDPFTVFCDNIGAREVVMTCREVVIKMSRMGRASTTDMSWEHLSVGRQRFNLLSSEGQRDLISSWIQARNEGEWERFVNHPFLLLEAPTGESGVARAYARPRDDQEAATEKSWVYPFKGDAARGLWEHIVTYYNPSNYTVYAHYAAIVQSSGMGKSRTVDELAKDHFVIPINLREATSSGYPPADHSIRDYLTTPGSKDVAYDRASAFLEALFLCTQQVLRDFDSFLDYGEVAKLFRSRMTVGQKMKGHSQIREDFYKRVIDMAKQREAHWGMFARPQASPGSDHPPNGTPTRSQDFPPYIEFQKLTQVLPPWEDESPCPSPTRAIAKGKQMAMPRQSSGPLVVLAFDEAHTTTQRHHAAVEDWSVFNELRHALRRLHGLPLFSLFLSTTGKISQFTSAVEEDLSKRVVEGTLVLIEPYTDLGFDPLARIITTDGMSLEQLTDDAQICSLGRPLFGARYQEGSSSVKREIIQFALAKLLNADYSTEELSSDQALACLSQRFPIEFKSTNYISQAKERKQVEGHMRICLKIDAAFETMTTTSSSEPILSEAAYFAMQKKLFKAPRALQSVMEGFSVSKGDRGEFLVLLLLTLARDATVGRADEFGRPVTGRRWFGLADFLYGHVFRTQALSSEWVDQDTIHALSMLQKDFPKAQLHFNHFVKVHEHKAIDIISLLLLQGRGGAILCGNNQTGADAINVFLCDGTVLVQDQAGLILHQIKNNPHYSMKPQGKLFDLMDPYELEILKVGTPAVPLVKIVFALAARRPSLNVVRHAATEEYPAVIYEIWCAGISPDILGPIEQQQVGIWESLLQASYGWKDLYMTPTAVAADLRRSAAPGAARDVGHYSRWAKRQ